MFCAYFVFCINLNEDKKVEENKENGTRKKVENN